MKIGIYNPYFESLSGGERYTLELASHWSISHTVTLFCDDVLFINKAEDRFFIDLSKVKITQNIFRKQNILNKLKESRNYDLIFFLTDGSVPTSLSRYNILHFQVPFRSLKAPWWKRRRFQAIVCNSEFTKAHIDPVFRQDAKVIYPPVNTDEFTFQKKKKIILSVGRFSNYFQSKKQEILIETFKTMLSQKALNGWRLVLAGGLLQSDKSYFQRLEDMCRKSPITLLPNIPYDKLKKLYETATIYWHGAGYGETDPTRMEHFGISTVEAMAAGCIPIVYRGGGLVEIIEDTVSGFLWNTKKGLADRTFDVIGEKINRNEVQAAVAVRARLFDRAIFYRAYDELLKEITS